MKYKKLLILLTIATLSLTACGKDSEPAEVPTETAVEETTPAETKPVSTWEREYLKGLYIGLASVAAMGLVALGYWIYRRCRHASS